MPGSAAPWRALEDDTSIATEDDGANPPAGIGTGLGSTRTAIAGGLGVAGLIAIAALWLVVTSGRGSVVVEGDGPVPGRSGAVALDPSGRPAHTSGGDVVVDVQGAVVKPGIVRLPPGARVADAIAAAGGFGPRVAADRVGAALNLAAFVHDGDQVIVPARGDQRSSAGPTGAGSGAASVGGSGAGGGPVDLNHATAAELDAMPGIGPATAAKIIAARENQPFATVDELRARKIVGAATFDKIKDLVVVR